MRVIGTAGHVDHGKSTLIAALTGTHPDRLKEEQEREMTIELGFGWMTLPDGQEVGIVDVPGHRDFIENMLAGVGGIDAALLVIAADEGVMPQTREHLAILDLLQIERGLVVITKTDLVDDPEWLEMIEGDVRTALSGSVLQNAPFVRVSARAGKGIIDLKQALAQLLSDSPDRLDRGRPRLPVDRVFSMPGFGTVVTGTLTDGHFSLGDEVEVLPTMLKGRVRGLQTHRKKEEIAVPGSRTAINVSGIAVEELQRGQVLAAPGLYRGTRRFDARVRIIKDLGSVVKHATQVKVFAGTSETIATLRILDAEELKAGDEAWVQLELRDELVVMRGDRYILRRPSPAETIGGGVVMDANPEQRHRRFDQKAITKLESYLRGTPTDLLFQAALALGPATLREVLVRAHLSEEVGRQALDESLKAGALQALEDESGVIQPDSVILATPVWMAIRQNIAQALAGYHKTYPLRRGMPREELKSRLKLPAKIFNQVLKRSEIQDGGAWLALPGHSIQFTASQSAKIQTLLAQFKSSPTSPPSVKECQAGVGEDVYAALVELGQLTQVGSEVVFESQAYQQMVNQVRGKLEQSGQVTAAEVRDMFGTSRKFALALLEHLDMIGVTIREGDFRRLKRP